MNKKLIALSFITLGLFAWTEVTHSEVTVVPIGNSIKPEGDNNSGNNNTRKRRRRRRARAIQLKAGTPLKVELGEILSSSFTQPGTPVLLTTAESIQVSGRTVIEKGAPVQASVIEVNDDRKEGKVVVNIKGVTGFQGDFIPLAGKINLDGEKSHALAKVGETFQVSTSEDMKFKIKRRAKKSNLPPRENSTQIGFLDLDSEDIKVNLKKGKIKGEALLIVEAPKGVPLSNIKTESLAITRINGLELQSPLRPVLEGKDAPESGDRNKNDTEDLTLTFAAWDFIKHQKPGKNILYLEGQMANGALFKAAANSVIEY